MEQVLMDKVLLLTSNNSAYRQRLSEAFTPSILSEDPNQAAIWLADPDKAANLLRQGYKPKWLAATFAGVDHLMAADLPTDYQLTNVRGILGPLMAQYVFAHLLSRLRQLPRYAAQQSDCLWQPHSYASLQGQTLVTLGTGDIAQHIAKVAHAFGMTCIGLNRTGHTQAGFTQTYPIEAMSQVFPLADVLVSVLPNTPAAYHLLNAQTLSDLPPHATLFNVGRGHTLCLEALKNQLDQHKLAHAVLDVFEQEPLAPDSPLWHHPSVTITPHIAASSFAEQVSQVFIANLVRYQQQQPLMYQVDFEQGY